MERWTKNRLNFGSLISSIDCVFISCPVQYMVGSIYRGRVLDYIGYSFLFTPLFMLNAYIYIFQGQFGHYVLCFAIAGAGLESSEQHT